MNIIVDTHYMTLIAIAASLVGALPLSPVYAAQGAVDAEAQAQEAWREGIVRTDVPNEGCFYAAYPSTDWLKVPCAEVSNLPVIPRVGAIPDTVGNGNDYFAEVSGLISRTVGSFPSVTTTGETGSSGANDYSLQLNTNFLNPALCSGHAGCSGWVQFAYSSTNEAAYIVFWLFNYGASCPSGWTSDSSTCYTESSVVSVPDVAVTDLATVKLSGKAVAKGRDTEVFTSGTQAWSTTAKDSLDDLATGWQYSEFGIYGDGYGSEAVFNTGTSIKVKIAMTDGSTTAPTCVPSSGGGTSEYNNLNLGKCHTFSGRTPNVTFTESN